MADDTGDSLFYSPDLLYSKAKFGVSSRVRCSACRADANGKKKRECYRHPRLSPGNSFNALRHQQLRLYPPSESQPALSFPAKERARVREQIPAPDLSILPGGSPNDF